MRSHLVPVAICLCAAAGPVLADHATESLSVGCQNVPCDFGLPGDLDDDGDVDAADFVVFHQCEAHPPSAPESVCRRADFDHEGTVDEADFALWQAHYTGSCECDPILKEPLTQQGQGLSISDLRFPIPDSEAPLDRRSETGDGPSLPNVPDKDGSDASVDPVANPSGPVIGDPNSMHRVHGFSGEFHTEVDDLRVRGRGIDLVWTRTYRSRLAPETAMGKGWDFSYNLWIEKAGEHLRLHNGHGRADVLFAQPDGAWSRPELFAVLEKLPAAGYALSLADGQRWSFRDLDGSPAAGKIDRIVDRNGNHLAFSYDVRGRLVTIHDTLDTSAHDRDLTIDYNDDGYIASITDFTGRRVSYGYHSSDGSEGSAGDLRSMNGPVVTGIADGSDFPAGKAIGYTYSRGLDDERLNHNLLTITDGKGQTWLTNAYGIQPDSADGLSFDRVVRQTYGGPDDHIDAVYQRVAPTPENNRAVVLTTVNDRAGNVHVSFYDARNRLVARRDYSGRADPDAPTDLARGENLPLGPLRESEPAYFETRYEYNNDSLCTRVLRPEMDQEQFIYDSGNPSPKSHGHLLRHIRLPGPFGADQPQLVETFEYDAMSRRLSRRIDPRASETRYAYDETGNCVRVQYPVASSGEYFEYNAFGQITAHVWPDGGNTHRRRDEFVYFSRGPQRGCLQSRIVDAGGLSLVMTYQYDPLGRLIRKVDPRGQDTRWVWNALDEVVRRISSESDAGTGMRRYRDYVYDANMNLTRLEEGTFGERDESRRADDLLTLFDYDILNRLVRRTQRVGEGQNVSIEFAYDANGNLTLTRYGEAASGNQPTNTTMTLFDERDLPFRLIRAAGDPLQSSTQYDYDGDGRVRRTTEGLESLTPHVTGTTHDGYGRLLRRVDPMGNEESRHYDPAGNLVARRIDGELNDAPGSAANVRMTETLYEYDEMGRKVRQIEKFFESQTQAALDDGEAVRRFEYTDSGLLRREIDDLGHAVAYGYDALGRLNLIRDQRGNSTVFAYDGNSNLVSITESEKSDLGRLDASFTRQFEYDGLNRLTRASDPLGHSWRSAWDGRGFCTVVTDPRGRETSYSYDHLGRLLQTIVDMNANGPSVLDAADIVISQRWDNSSLVSQTDANLNTTSYTHDPLDRLTSIRLADGTTTTVVHDVFDQPNTTTTPGNTTVRSTYDPLNRLTSRSVTRGPGIVGAASETYAYDGLSRLVAGADDDSTITRQYDSLGHLVRETQEVGPGGPVRSVSTTYNSLGQRVLLGYPGGRLVGTSYDVLGRPAVIRDETPGASSLVAAYSYAGRGRLERREMGNGVRLELSYDDDRRVIALRYSVTASGTLLQERTYTWDELDNRTLVENPSASGATSCLYLYDAAGRLLQSQRTPGPLAISYSLDGAGNRINITGGPDAGDYLLDPTTPEPADLQMNQYTVIPSQLRTYDRSGNIITAGSTRRYAYDYRGQLAELTDLTAGLTVLYKYDVLGRCIEKNAAGLITRYYYAGNQLIEEQNPSNITLATFVQPISPSEERGFRETAPLQFTRSAQRYYPLADDLGSSIALANSAGVIVERYEYGDFGRPVFQDAAGTLSAGSPAGNPFLFRGLRYEPESGLYQLMPISQSPVPQLKSVYAAASRIYDPLTGRFSSRASFTPWFPPGSLGNPYAAWQNNPTR